MIMHETPAYGLGKESLGASLKENSFGFHGNSMTLFIFNGLMREHKDWVLALRDEGGKLYLGCFTSDRGHRMYDVSQAGTPVEITFQKPGNTEVFIGRRNNK